MNFCETSKNTFSCRTPAVAASIAHDTFEEGVRLDVHLNLKILAKKIFAMFLVLWPNLFQPCIAFHIENAALD